MLTINLPCFWKRTHSVDASISEGSNKDFILSSGLESPSNENLAQTDGRQTLNSIMVAKRNPSTVFKPLFGINTEEHHTRLGEHAQRLWKNKKMTDLTVKLEGSKYPCHKTVLSCYSKYFKQLLLKEKESLKEINLRIPSVTKVSFEVLLVYMYTSNLNLTCQNIGEVYTAARKLGMNGALNLCKRILSGENKHYVYSVYVYVTAKKEHLEDCAAKAMKIMTRRFEHIVGTPEFLDLDFSQVREYLTQDVLATRSEVIVYLAALKWLSVKFLEREEHAAAVIQCVRFPMMTLNEILACFSPPLLPGILELKEIKDIMMKSTCYVAAALVNEEKRFERYSCKPRKYLLKREPVILWDPNIFDSNRHEMYRKEMAATRIQAAYRGFSVRKSIQIDKAAPLVKSSSESMSDDENSDVESDKVEKEERRTKQENPSPQYNKNKKSRISRTDDENDNDSFSSQKKRSNRRSSSIDTLVDRVNDLAESTEIKRYNSDPRINSEMFQNTPSKPETIHKIYTMPSIDYDEDYNEKRSDLTCDESMDSNDNCVNKMPHRKISNSISEENMAINEDLKGYILVAGGFRTENVEDDSNGRTMFIYNVAKNKWKRYGTMSEARHHHSLVLLHDEAYFIGGCNLEKSKSGRMVPDKNCYKVDLRTRKWSQITEMNHSRMYHGTAVVGGKIYVVGGKDDEDRLLRSIEVLNPKTDKWEELDENLPTSRMGSGVCAHEGKIWIVGGVTEEKNGILHILDEVQCYDPYKKRWIHNIRQLPSPRAFSTVVPLDGEIFIIGGTCENAESQEGQLKSVSDVLAYNKTEKQWAIATVLPFPRHFVRANAIGSRLYIFGGLTSYPRTTIDDVIVFEKKTGKWHNGAPLPKLLCGFSSMSIPELT